MIKRKLPFVLMLIGYIFMSLSFFTRHFFTMSEDLTDFFKGFGLALIFGGFIVIAKQKRNCCWSHMEPENKNS